ncbi:MAG: diacylglycerol kinase family protein [Erysipelotrichaceae bacterium]|nr:diacylglycerol kinase family protein [Erysipelotrichaceae bacterium]MDY6035844.1 diacylglycerol kinase family protein [Bulleidia sp.]
MINKFRVAFVGLLSSLKDKSILTQYAFACIACIVGWILKFEYLEWLAIILCIGLVITTEMVNTCIEKLCDLYSIKLDDRIKYIKDLGAGAVLFSALISLVVGIIIVLHHM